MVAKTTHSVECLIGVKTSSVFPILFYFSVVKIDPSAFWGTAPHWSIFLSDFKDKSHPPSPIWSWKQSWSCGFRQNRKDDDSPGRTTNGTHQASHCGSPFLWGPKHLIWYLFLREKWSEVKVFWLKLSLTGKRLNGLINLTLNIPSGLYDPNVLQVMVLWCLGVPLLWCEVLLSAENRSTLLCWELLPVQKHSWKVPHFALCPLLPCLYLGIYPPLEFWIVLFSQCSSRHLSSGCVFIHFVFVSLWCFNLSFKGLKSSLPLLHLQIIW